MWRPSPLIRARRFEEALNTKARIYVKYEGGSAPVGSHKTNSAVAQAYYNSLDGVTKLTTETGAGQWGSALAFAGAQFGIDVEVWQVRASYSSKPYRGFLIRTYGGTIHPSPPSDLTESGRAMLAKDPDTTGSLGMAVSEAVEVAASHPDTRYALGSVLNHVVLHQSVIGVEAVDQLNAVEPGGATSSSVVPVEVPISRDSPSRSCGRSCTDGRTRAWSRPSRPLARPSPRVSTATTTAMSPVSHRCSRCIRSEWISFRIRSMLVVCATTAWRRR